ncbi:uncharacterized protein LOC143246919 [Tachypleus tridentatus]|uniref:uncharacterized protein LOC143246919 n=1 Tax=Tachypleus tridentatus TaxID=6853 RepID=UPI003FD308FC
MKTVTIIATLLLMTIEAIQDTPQNLECERCCCLSEQLSVDLKDGFTEGSVEGIKVINNMDQSVNLKSSCRRYAKVEVNFTRLECDYCLASPACGRKMLKIDLILDQDVSATGWLFNVGDSATNNGYGGDASTQSKDAEIQGLVPNIGVFKNDDCSSGLLETMSGALEQPNVKRVTIYVSNMYVRVQNDMNFDKEINSCLGCRALFALAGQTDSQGPPNETIFVALNGVIRYTEKRTGTGVCKVILSWACPC